MSGSLASTQLPAAVSSAVYNADNQLTEWGSTAMTYDLNGNTLNDGTNTYTWDARNRLVSADSGSATFAYDALGRRIGKTINSANTNFLYDGVNPVQELNGTTPTANLLTGGIDERFTRTDASGTLNYITDALGSTIALTDPSGNSNVQYSYDPYGSMNATGSTTNSYTYTGREFDGLGLYYYRARYYDPATGRFISEDPMWFAGSGTNLYLYASDNPVQLRDPLGLCPGPISGALSAFEAEAAAVIPNLSGTALQEYLTLETQQIAVIGKLADTESYLAQGFNVFSGAFDTPAAYDEANFEWVASVVEQQAPIIIASDLTEANLGDGSLTNVSLMNEGFTTLGDELGMFLDAGYDFALVSEADEAVLVLALF